MNRCHVVIIKSYKIKDGTVHVCLIEKAVCLFQHIQLFVPFLIQSKGKRRLFEYIQLLCLFNLEESNRF